jgi:hypothetical protein
MSLFSSSKSEKKQEPKKINIQDLIEDNKALSEELLLDETPTVSESELVETSIILESEPVDSDETPIEVKDAKAVPEILEKEESTFGSPSEADLSVRLKKKIADLSKESQEELVATDVFETKEDLLAPSKEIFSEEELSFASVAGEDSPETTSSNEDFFDEISPKEKEVNEGKDSSANKTNDFFEDLKDSTAKSNVVKVPRVFLNWFEKADKNATVFEAYSLVDLEDDTKLKDWVKENQNIFAKIWLGDVIPELELELYMTSIPNYDGKLPNVLVRTEEGKYVIKTSEDILSSDEFRLTEQEILKDWEYLFTNGFSELLD